jgi:cyclomaltodextrinase / maltogenic alpha-amylase / neopullulanase
MLKKYFHYGWLKISILFLSIAFSYAQQTNDIISLINLKAGQTDSILISDLYFAENYNVTFYSTKKIITVYKPVEQMLYLTPAEDFEGMDLVKFKHGNIFYHIPIKSELIKTYTFEYTPQKPVNKINLFGSFNSWNRENLVLSDKGNGTFSIDISLEPGTYEYKFFVDGEEIVDPNNPHTKPNGFGGFNSLLTIEKKNLGKNYLHIINAEKNEENISINFFLENENSNIKLIRDNLIALLDNQRIIDKNIKINGNSIEIIVTPDQQKRFKIVRLAVTQNGASTNFQSFFLKNFEREQTQIHDKIIYALMIDRFKDGDKSNSNPVQHPELLPPANYQGGDLQGILDKINDGYFTKLGINTLWISPVVDNTNEAYQEYPPPHRFYTGYHGYWPVSSAEVEEKFGDMALLKSLIKTAHEKGIKILLDFVSNHIHIEHPLWEKNREWFGVLELPDGTKNLRLWDEQRLTTWFEPYMPSFDYLGSEEALEAMTDNAVWWLKETGADGFRHDAVKHVPNEFWRMLTKKLKTKLKKKRFIRSGKHLAVMTLSVHM